MTDQNIVVIIGRLTKDTAIKQSKSGLTIAEVSIAVNKSFSANGEKREEVSFFNCTAFGKSAEILQQYGTKGKQLSIQGSLKQNRWTDQASGQNRSAINIIIDRFQLLGGKVDQQPVAAGVQEHPPEDLQEFADDIPF